MSRVITVDFTGVEVGGGRIRIPEGDYGVKIKEIKHKKGEESQKPYLDIRFEVTKGDKKGLKKVLSHSCSLQTQSLWNLRNLLESCGKQVPSKAVKLDLDKVIGAECACTVVDDEYEGKKKSIISAFFPLDDLGNTSEDGSEIEEGVEEPDEEEEKPKKKKVAKKKEEDEEEPAADEETEDLFS